MKSIVSAAAIGLTLFATPAFAASEYHDENTTQHIGRATTPASTKAGAPIANGYHDENTSVRSEAAPAMGAKASAHVVLDQHDENAGNHLK